VWEDGRQPLQLSTLQLTNPPFQNLLPPKKGPDGAPAVPHASRVKVRLQSFEGWWADRVPAWTRFATIPPGEMGAKFNGVHWDPPEGERHAW
jgi:hypothetical protein